jgi:hypothetical protein
MPRLFKFDFQSKRLSELSAYPQESEAVWSSAPYPVVTQDSANATAALVGGSLRVGVYSFTEHGDLGASLLAGSLRPALQTYSAQPESADLMAQIVGGQLRPVLRSYSGLPESADLSAQLTGGQLKVVLINYNTWAQAPESGDMSATLLSGYLGP